MKKNIIIFLSAFLVIYIGGFLFAISIQEKLIYLGPSRTNEECERNIEEDVVRHGNTMLYHSGVEESDTVVVFYHGNANIVCDMVFVMDILDEKNVSYIFPEYTGYSEDNREAAHKGVLENVEDTVDYIEKEGYENVYVIGQSIGSGAASYHAELKAPEKLLLITPFTTLTNVISEMFPVYPRFFVEKFVEDYFDNIKRLKNYEGDLVILHGTKDPVIDISHSRELLEKIPAENKKLFIAEGYGHASINDSSEMVEVIENLVE